MKHRALAHVRARLEVLEAQLSAMEPSADPQEIYDRLEGLAIAILDSEFMDYGEGELEEYLLGLLHLRAMELGIMKFPDQKSQP
jgi:hypothetical protein